MNLLVPYVPQPDHPDPLFVEFTYGDHGPRGRRLRSLHQGDYVFFHTSSRGAKVITAFYVVDRVVPTRKARSDQRLRLKYRNPHLLPVRQLHEDDFILFGDPILSSVLPRPIPLNKELITKLSLRVPFPRGRSVAQAIGSATRASRSLSPKDVRILIAAANRAASSKATRSLLVRSTEEVAEIVEKDVEEHLARNPAILGKSFSLQARQLQIQSGRIDLLFRSPNDTLLLVEVKLGRIGREAIAQLEGYLAEFRHSQRRPIRGAIVCAGVMPGFQEDIAKKRSIDILIYSWRLQVQPWILGSA